MGEIRFNGEVYGTSETGGADIDTLKDIYYGSLEERQLLAEAITDKGVETKTADSLATMAENIGHIYEGGNAMPIHITAGFTAWVNGVLVTGTRPAPSTQQSGSFVYSVPAGGSTTAHVVFPKKFLEVPGVVTSTSYNKVQSYPKNITVSGCDIYLTSSSSWTQEYTIYWTANGLVAD